MAEAVWPSTLALPQLRVKAIDWALAHRELIAVASIMAVAAAMRFWQLDAKALHHDESLHAEFTWFLYQGRGYKHDPLMHGPFLFDSGAISFFLFGASNFTARIMPALFGTILVGMPYLLRKQIGMRAVLIASVLIAISPTLLYVSRFDRHDIYITVWMLGLTVCAWRYLEQQRDAYLYAFAALLALSFATMETTFINVAIMLVFFDLMLALELGKRQPDEDIDRLQAALRIVALVPIAWAIAALWPLLGKKPMGGRERLPPVGDLLVLLGTLSLPQFAAAIQVLPFVGDKGYEVAAEDTLRNATLLSLLIASVIVGMFWRRRTWGVAAIFFYVPWVLMFTTMFTNMHGIFSGSWGSLDYWLSQQDVRRGNQPTYYYGMMVPLYEFLPLLLAIGGAAFIALRGSSIKRWLLFWLGGTALALTMAGEKMPWLTVHIALPLCLVAAVALAAAIDGLEMTPARWRAAAMAAGVTAASVLALVMGHGGVRLAGMAGMAALLGWSAASGLRFGVKDLARATLTIAVAALGVLTVRTAFMLSYQHPDLPNELAVYTQTSPQLTAINDRIAAVAKSSGLGYNLPIVVDGTDSNAWPWAWYLRDYHDVSYVDPHSPGFQLDKSAVFLVDKANVSQFQNGSYSATPYVHRWWFCETYRTRAADCNSVGAMSAGDLAHQLTSWSVLKHLGHFFLYRRPVQGNYGSDDAVALIPLQYSQFDTAKAQTPLSQKLGDGRIAVGRGGNGPGELQQPDDVYVDKQGTIWVADGKNNRIDHFDAQGHALGALTTPFSPGALNEPWSLAMDDAGFTYVTDTWNHRILKFDRTGQFVATWGQPAVNTAAPGPLDLFGPRDIVVDDNGSLYVTDTGNNRILQFSPTGQPLGSFGGPGSAPGQFSEPVGLARDDAGHFYVADAWNGRIQRFDRGFVNPVVIPVPWTSHEVADKPYIAVLKDGRILATVPEKGALLLYDGTGKPLSSWQPGSGVRPIGVAAMPDGGFVFTDSGSNNLQIVPAGAMATLFK